jgi:hypothetical protein
MALYESVVPLLSLVEVFPIPGDPGDSSDALGLSVPSKNANDRTWQELQRLIETLQVKFGASVTELYSGQPVTPSTINAVKQRLLGK